MPLSSEGSSAGVRSSGATIEGAVGIAAAGAPPGATSARLAANAMNPITQTSSAVLTPAATRAVGSFLSYSFAMTLLLKTVRDAAKWLPRRQRLVRAADGGHFRERRAP